LLASINKFTAIKPVVALEDRTEREIVMLQLYPLQSGEEKLLNIPVILFYFWLVFGRLQKQRIEHK
jgi:hypothetical protein